MIFVVEAMTDWVAVMIYKLSWHDEISGLFKGYGFACFHNKVSALQARHVLEGQEVGGHTVDCGWLKEGSHKVSDLDSKVRNTQTRKIMGIQTFYSTRKWLFKCQSLILDTNLFSNFSLRISTDWHLIFWEFSLLFWYDIKLEDLFN